MGRSTVCNREMLSDLLDKNGASLKCQPRNYNQKTRVTFECKCGQIDTQSIEKMMRSSDISCSLCKEKDKISTRSQSDMKDIIKMILAL